MRRECEYTIESPERIELAVNWLRQMAFRGLKSGKPVVARIGRERRNLEQNAKLWALLHDISKQVEWYGQKLGSEDWKHIFSSAVLEIKTVPGIDGGIVVLGQSTSRMNKKQFSDLIECIYSFGAERGVQWSEPVPKEYQQFAGRA